mgnify:CR=1 FL=1
MNRLMMKLEIRIQSLIHIKRKVLKNYWNWLIRHSNIQRILSLDWKTWFQHLKYYMVKTKIQLLLRLVFSKKSKITKTLLEKTVQMMVVHSVYKACMLQVKQEMELLQTPTCSTQLLFMVTMKLMIHLKVPNKNWICKARYLIL